MKNLKILNTREKKELIRKLHDTYGFIGEIDYNILESEEKIIIAKDISNIDIDKLRIYSLGIVLCDKKKMN